MKIAYLFSPFFLLFSIASISAQVTYENAFPNLSFSAPVEIQNTGVPSDDRLFVVEQRGIIKVFDNNPAVNTTNVFLDIENEVYFGFGAELGLLGLAFHPNYQQNGYFYIYYTKRVGSSNAIITVERIGVNPNNPDAADLSNRLVLFEFTKNQSNSNHNGGKIAFGPDGYLYASIGDGGGANDPSNNARNVNRFFGKILRIDVDLDGDNSVDNNGILPDGNYEIPSDNPLVGQNGQDEIYAWGIRNTWKMSFDQFTGRLWGSDVGQGDFEEINLIQNGGHYGWDRFEGNSIEDNSVPDPGNTIFPALEYNHNQGDVSITGGYVYRGSEISSLSPSLFGKYIFGDYSSGRVWAMDYDPATGTATREFLFRASSFNISSFGEDLQGEIYFTNYGLFSGTIYKIVDGVSSPNAANVSGFGEWCNAIPATNGTIHAMEKDANNQLYIAGNFSEVNGWSANNIAVWNGTTWSTLGSGSNGSINTLAFDGNGGLYAGGAFTEIGGIAASNIAKWDGNTWQALGTGTSGPVAALKIDGNDKLYVGGTFESAGGITSNNIAYWDGTWSAMIDAVNAIAGTTNEIRSIEVDENDVVYVGGNFASAGGNSASRIATWNGNTWGTLGAGTSGFVQAILNTSDYIYAAGNFGVAGNQTVNRITRWNKATQTWEKLEEGLSNVVNDLVAYNGYIYAAGSFPIALNESPEANIVVGNIARWKENEGWEALGESTDVGVDNLINALLFIGDTLYVGGNFELAGGSSADNLACWQEACPSIRQVASLNPSGTFQSDSLTTNTGDCVIQSQAEFKAGDMVRLQEGFHAQSGSQFAAKIEVCGISMPINEVVEDRDGQLEENTISAKADFHVFPNPATHTVNFKYKLAETSQIELNLYDLNGRLIDLIIAPQKQAAGEYSVEYSLDNLQGMYWVEVRTADGRMTKKLFVLEK
ncbi:MAG: PQQ-dependent sugar dehydrogenase [Bacteroidota bacterium]